MKYFKNSYIVQARFKSDEGRTPMLLIGYDDLNDATAMLTKARNALMVCRMLSDELADSVFHEATGLGHDINMPKDIDSLDVVATLIEFEGVDMGNTFVEAEPEPTPWSLNEAKIELGAILTQHVEDCDSEAGDDVDSIDEALGAALVAMADAADVIESTLINGSGFVNEEYLDLLVRKLRFHNDNLPDEGK